MRSAEDLKKMFGKYGGIVKDARIIIANPNSAARRQVSFK